MKKTKEKRIGKVTHYFNKIKVGVIKLSDTLSLGDEIIVKSKTEERFKQKVASMEIDGEKIKKAKKGQEVGLKLKDTAREGYLVFKA
jgi:putative protease